jgi:hypothetical protein
MHENDDRTVGRSLGKIVHAMACNLDGAALDAGEVFVQVNPRIEIADGAEKEPGCREQREDKQGPKGSLDPTRGTI